MHLKFLCLLLIGYMSFGQNSNITLLDSDYQENGTDYNDIWGFKEKGKDYLLVGKVIGFSIYEVTFENTLRLVVNVEDLPADVNTPYLWAELRYYRGYVYKSSEQDQVLLYQVDLENGTYSYIKKFGNASHNLYLYKDALYLCGGDNPSRGISVFDLTDPINPQLLWTLAKYYVHDLSIQDDKLYTAEIGNSSFAIYDISNVVGNQLTENELILRHKYSNGYTHNVYPTLDGKHVVTTDETSSVEHLKVWNVENPQNIIKTFSFRENSNSIVHNAFIKDNYIYTSYYTLGTLIFDATDINNIQKIGQYDIDESITGASFQEAWGVYPFLVGNLFAVSTFESGVYLFSFDQLSNGGLSKFIVHDSNGAPIEDVQILSINEQFKYRQNLDTVTIKSELGSFPFKIRADGYETVIQNVVVDEQSIPEFQITLSVDTTRPETPSGFTGMQNDSIIVLQWTESGDSDFFAYNIYDSEKLENDDPNPLLYEIIDQSKTSLNIPINKFYQDYRYRISVIDYNQMESDLSSEVLINAVDSEPPEVFSYIIYPSDENIRHRITYIINSNEFIDLNTSSITSNKSFSTSGFEYFYQDDRIFYSIDIELEETGGYEFDMALNDIVGNTRLLEADFVYGTASNKRKEVSLKLGRFITNKPNYDYYIHDVTPGYNEQDLEYAFEFKSIGDINNGSFQYSSSSHEIRVLDEQTQTWTRSSSGNQNSIITYDFEKSEIIGIFKVSPDEIKQSYILARNYPNPFNPSTTIEVELVRDMNLEIVIYNILGQRIDMLHKGRGYEGINRFRWNAVDQQGRRVPSGLYFYQIITKNKIITNKMMVLK